MARDCWAKYALKRKIGSVMQCKHGTFSQIALLFWYYRICWTIIRLRVKYLNSANHVENFCQCSAIGFTKHQSECFGMNWKNISTLICLSDLLSLVYYCWVFFFFFFKWHYSILRFWFPISSPSGGLCLYLEPVSRCLKRICKKLINLKVWDNMNA